MRRSRPRRHERGASCRTVRGRATAGRNWERRLRRRHELLSCRGQHPFAGGFNPSEPASRPEAAGHEKRPTWSRPKSRKSPRACRKAMLCIRQRHHEFIRLSILEVVKTLFEAIVLVVLVMFIFLQSWRATLIPSIAVPVVLLGTFGVLYALGFSINTLTMFGMVLAIGLLVDDAIVVVENIERLMREKEHSPLDATRSRWSRSRGAGGDRPRAVGGVPADGVLRRLDRRHLPPVLGHDRLGDGAVGVRRADPEPGDRGQHPSRNHATVEETWLAAAPRSRTRSKLARSSSTAGSTGCATGSSCRSPAWSTASGYSSALRRRLRDLVLLFSACPPASCRPRTRVRRSCRSGCRRARR